MNFKKGMSETMKGKKLLALVMAFAIVSPIMSIQLKAEVISNVSSADEGMTTDDGRWYTADQADVVFSIGKQKGEAIHLPVGEPIAIEVSIPQSDRYFLLLEYHALKDIILKSTLSVELAGQSCRTQIYSLWKDKTKDYSTDRHGNEIPADQVAVDSPVTDYVQDQSRVSKRPFSFELPSGTSKLILTSDDVDLELYGIQVVQERQQLSYEEYASDIADQPDGQDSLIIEAEDYRIKSDSYIRAGAERNPALYPYNYRTKKLNVLDAASYSTAGQKVMYDFEITHAGIYFISFRYSQNYKEDIPVYRNIRIDSRDFCDVLRSVPFSYTGTDYSNTTIRKGGTPAGIYLTAGKHTLIVEADGTPVQTYIDRLYKILKDLSGIGMDVKKVSGTGASEYRTWDVESYLPGVTDKLSGYRDELMEIYTDIGKLQKKNSAAGLNIKMAAENLKKLLKNPDKLPGKLSLLSEGSGSATQFLSNQIDKLTYQNLSVDRIYIHGSQSPLPDADAGFFTNIIDGCKRLLHSIFFSNVKDEKGDDSQTLKVWVNRPIQYVEIMQSMADTAYTPEKEIKVEISVMSSEQRIILSNSTNSSPDVVMGIGSGMPYDLGIRGAVADLMQFDDFSSYMQKEYNIQSLVPHMLDNKVFGVTETQEFYVLMMRTDIMKQLKLQTPNTWDDVAAMMPALRRNSMNFYLQLSGYTGTKPLYTTVPFILQTGGSLYSDNGLTTAIQSKESLRGFEILANLYSLYSVQPVVSSFYNSFRYGQIPIGIASFTDYVKIKNAAPEITGLWEIALHPGMDNGSGQINRGTTGAASACAIMESSEQKEQGWEFLKWWLSSNVQADFGNSLQMTYGPDYLWNTANREAFKQLSFPEDDKAVILEQWNHMQEISRHPAMYAIERELSTAWMNVVFNGVSTRIALDNAALNINREFERKLEEFDYIKRDGTVNKTFVFRPIEEILKGVKS